MKGLLLVLLVTAITLTVGCAQAPPQIDVDATPQETPTQINADITPQEAAALIQDNRGNPDFVIIDVRTPQEFAQGHLANAINLDYYAGTFRDELNQRDRNKTYLVYCASGWRSDSALAIMEELGFKEAYNMQGGIDRWQEEKLPTVK